VEGWGGSKRGGWLKKRESQDASVVKSGKMQPKLRMGVPTETGENPKKKEVSKERRNMGSLENRSERQCLIKEA